MQKLREECGVFGIYAKDNREVATTAYYGLFALQHRGQESCGIAVCNDGVIAAHKDIGLVEEVFTPETLTRLGQGHMAVGHVRYGTTGATDRNNAQPIVVNHCKGSLALAHNGNLVNSFALREELELTGSIFHTTSDTEVISYVITKERLSAPSIEEAVDRAMDKLQGAYSLVVIDGGPGPQRFSAPVLWTNRRWGLYRRLRELRPGCSRRFLHPGRRTWGDCSL